MDSVDISPLVEDLGDTIGELETALGPLLNAPLSETVSKLPILEKAKLQLLATYAIESMIFSILKLNGINAREHAVFKELARVKQYFDKVKEVEEGGPKKRENLRLDKAAASRFIKHSLAGNNDAKVNKHLRFDQMDQDVGSHQRLKSLSDKRHAEDEPLESTSQAGGAKKQRLSEANEDATTVVSTADTLATHNPSKEEEEKSRRKEKKHAHHHKSSKPPKSGKAAFDELVNKPQKQPRQGKSA